MSAALTAAALGIAVPSALAGTQYWLTGRGWGHGIGLSQYGAQGFAEHGYTAQQIIQYYYQGTTIGAPSAPQQNIDVLLASGRTSAVVHIDAAGATVTAGGSPIAIPVGADITTTVAASKLTVKRTLAGVTTTLASGVAGPVQFDGADGSMHPTFQADNGFSGRHYRGSLRMHVAGGKLSVVNHVNLDKYVRGVVPGEVPASWLPATLQAQAIAARSYALATSTTSGIYDVHCDTRSQMYVGIEGEAASTNAAVAATTQQVALSGGKVIPAFFSSTSGGRTAAIEDVWNSEPRSYLKSMPDPFERSPYSRWKEQLTFTPQALALKLGLSAPLRSVSTTINHSARVSAVTFNAGPATQTMSGTGLQFKLGLRSSYFRFIRLSIAPALKTVRAGQRTRLVGVAPKGATIWVRTAGSSWVKTGAVQMRSGAYVRRVRVRSTTVYQLRVGSRVGPAAKITVA